MNGQPAAEEKVFRYRVDVYWRALALYSLALLGYGFVRGGFTNGSITVALADPIALLLLVFVVWTAFVLLWVWYRQPVIRIGQDYLCLQNRWGERYVPLSEIDRMVVSQRRRGWGRLVRIRLKGQRRIIIVRPAAYERPQELLYEFIRLSRRLRAA